MFVIMPDCNTESAKTCLGIIHIWSVLAPEAVAVTSKHHWHICYLHALLLNHSHSLAAQQRCLSQLDVWPFWMKVQVHTACKPARHASGTLHDSACLNDTKCNPGCRQHCPSRTTASAGQDCAVPFSDSHQYKVGLIQQIVGIPARMTLPVSLCLRRASTGPSPLFCTCCQKGPEPVTQSPSLQDASAVDFISKQISCCCDTVNYT